MSSPQSDSGLHTSMVQSSEHSSLHPKSAMPEGSSSVMNTSDWRPTQGDEIFSERSDWRLQLQADSRQRIINKIMDTLKRHLPFRGQEGLQELMKIAVRFEEKIYSAATSQSDYLRKISLKMLTMETKGSLNPPQPNFDDLNLPDPVASRDQLVADLQCKFGKWMNNLGCEG